MPTSNKYNNKPKVSIWTYVAILGFIVALILLLIFTAPNSHRRIYQSFRDSQFTFGEAINEHKFNSDHHFRAINERQLLRAIERDELTVVFFGNPADQNSFNAIQDVNAYFGGAVVFRGSESPHHIAPSALYTQNIISNIRFLDIEGENMARLSERINERLAEDADDINWVNVPMLAAFMNGEVIEFEFSLVGQQGIRNIRDFFQNVFEAYEEIRLGTNE